MDVANAEITAVGVDAELDGGMTTLDGSTHLSTSSSEALTERFDNKDWPLNTIWTATGQELRAATEGTVWAHIVREGRVLAGDPHLFDDITIKPMTPHTVRLQLGLTVRRLRRAATATVARAHEPEWERMLRQTEGTADSARAAQGVTAVLSGLAGPRRSGKYHLVAGARSAALAEYALEHVEAQPVWERRVTDVLALCVTLFEGTLTGRGPLAALRDPARKHGLSPAAHGKRRQDNHDDR